MKFKKYLYFIAFILSIQLWNGCKKDEKNTPTPDITNGVFIVNEGSFGSGNSSVSYLSLATNSITNNLFENVNGFPLGDVAQSLSVHNNKVYVIVNNSQKIEVLNSSNFTHLHTINGLQGPRYIVAKNNKGYISDWFANEVVVLDLNTNAITKHIPVGNGPEQMVIYNDILFVTNVGGFGNDSTISIINLVNETNVGTLHVGVNPNSIQLDANGKLWVLCGGSTGPDYIGGTSDDLAGSLWKINPNTFSVELQFTLSTSAHPIKLQTNGAKTDLYFLDGVDGYTGTIKKININSTNFNPVLVVNKSFYGLGIDPVSGTIYGAYVPGFTQNGQVFRYTPTSTLIDSLSVGIAPNWFTFN